MSSSSTWAEEGTNTFFNAHPNISDTIVETGERMPKKRLSFIRRMIPYIIIIIFSLAIIVAVIVTGVLFNKSVKKTENRHSLDLANGDCAPHKLLSSLDSH
jgi:amino acid transporter